jgi:hypothetical protein
LRQVDPETPARRDADSATDWLAGVRGAVSFDT